MTSVRALEDLTARIVYFSMTATVFGFVSLLLTGLRL